MTQKRPWDQYWKDAGFWRRLLGPGTRGDDIFDLCFAATVIGLFLYGFMR